MLCAEQRRVRSSARQEQHSLTMERGINLSESGNFRVRHCHIYSVQSVHIYSKWQYLFMAGDVPILVSVAMSEWPSGEELRDRHCE